MTSNKHWFGELKEVEGGSVILGSDEPCAVRSIGAIRLKFSTGLDRIITQVRYVPDLKRNLLSCGMLNKKGYEFKGKNRTLKVSHGSLVIMKANIVNGMYILEQSTIVGSMSSTEVDKYNLWHLRLRYISERGLNELSKHDLLCGDKIQKLSFCENCVIGKSK